MAIALMGIATALTLGTGALAFGGKIHDPLDETLRKAVREARLLASVNGCRTTIEWNDENATFEIRDPVGKLLLEMQSEARPEHDYVEFSRCAPPQQTTVPDTYVTLEELDKVLFSPDFSCTPFVARVVFAGEEIHLRQDPFSNLRMEEAR
jgi:hypothetical protein